jgi:hypothetical protein
MNRDDIIRMAREAGFIINNENSATWSLERFAALVIQEDRQKLAKTIEAMPFGDTASSFAKFVREFQA